MVVWVYLIGAAVGMKSDLRVGFLPEADIASLQKMSLIVSLILQCSTPFSHLTPTVRLETYSSSLFGGDYRSVD